MPDYTKVTLKKCFNCHCMSMEKVEVDYEKIRLDMQLKYNEGFNAGYKKAKEEIRKKFNAEILDKLNL